MVFDDVAGEHDLLVRDKGDDVAGGVSAAKEHQLHTALAEMKRHLLAEGLGRPGQAGDAFMPFEQAREARELAVPVLLPALVDHGMAGFRGDDLRRVIGRGAQHAHRMIVREHNMLDRLVGDGADLLDHHVGKPRRRLRVDDHDAVVADNDAGIGVALGGKGPEIAPDLGEADRLFRHVALRGEFLSHSNLPLIGRCARKCWRRHHHAFRSRHGRRTA